MEIVEYIITKGLVGEQYKTLNPIRGLGKRMAYQLSAEVNDDSYVYIELFREVTIRTPPKKDDTFSLEDINDEVGILVSVWSEDEAKNGMVYSIDEFCRKYIECPKTKKIIDIYMSTLENVELNLEEDFIDTLNENWSDRIVDCDNEFLRIPRYYH